MQRRKFLTSLFSALPVTLISTSNTAYGKKDIVAIDGFDKDSTTYPSPRERIQLHPRPFGEYTYSEYGVGLYYIESNTEKGFVAGCERFLLYHKARRS